MYSRIKRSLQSRYRNYSYNRFAKGVPTSSFEIQQLRAEGYYSQCGQDKWLIENIFNDREDGIFVDIGAHDGVSFSNTLKLEQLGWKGIAVEPMPQTYATLAENRSCITVNGCIHRKSGKDFFRLISGYSQMLSGLVSEYDSRHLARIDREIKEHGGSYQDIEVNCFNFNELVFKHKLNHIHYLNLDVEGGELAVLENIDFNQIEIDIIGVENNYLDYRIPSLLAKNGFKLISIVGDEFYINKRCEQS